MAQIRPPGHQRGICLGPLYPSELRGVPPDVPRGALARLFLDITQPITWALSRPCAVFKTAQQTRVEFLGCIAWVANRDRRRLQLELRDDAGRWQTAVCGFDLEHPLADDCRAGKRRIFTVEHAGTGAPRATVGLELRNGAWHTGQARGPKDADPGPEMLEIAQDLLNRYRILMQERAWARRAMPIPNEFGPTIRGVPVGAASAAMG